MAESSDHAVTFIRQIENAFVAKAVFPRNCYPDKSLTRLFRRATTTATAIARLTRSGYGADALGLTRSLIDDWLVVRWITNKETEVRGTLFFDFWAKQLERVSDLSEQYGPEDQEIVPLTATVEERAAQFKKWSTLGPTAKQMEEEEEVLDPGSTMQFARGWTYDVLFFLTSCYIHPTAIGVRHRGLPMRSVLSFDRANEDSEAEQALVAVGAFVAQIANRISVFWGLNLTGQIEAYWREYSAKILPDGGDSSQGAP
jgi:Family of unknown function (DUF5677)